MIFRRSTDSDAPGIEAVLRDIGLWYSRVTLDDFWLAEEEGQIVAVAHTGEAGDDLFLDSVGVIPSLRGRGIASEMVERIASETTGDIYLYTIIPGFFERLGFERAEAPASIPERDVFDCEGCEPDRCACMVRHRDDS